MTAVNARWKAALAQTASHYGMAIVLMLLCVYISVATITPQRPTGNAAADDVASRIPGGATVLIVGRSGAEDAAFVDRVATQLATKEASIDRVTGSPADARAALEHLAATGKKVGIIAASPEAASWSVFDQFDTRFPAHAGAKIVSPETRRWPTFLNRDNLLNVANQVVVIALLAVGMTLVIITGGIDLSVGSLVAFSAVATALFIRHGGGTDAGAGTMFLGSVVGVVACGVIGLLTGVLVTSFRLPPFIATLGMMQIASGAAYMLAHGQSIYEIPDAFTGLGRGAAIFGIPNAAFVMLCVYAVAHVAMSMTTFGRYVYATGGNKEAARLSGVRTNFILIAVYAISGLTAGLGGVVVTSQLKAGAPTYGAMYELYAIAAVVVGGTSLSGGSGRILGTLIGALIIAVIQNGMNLMGVESYLQKVVLGVVILAAVILDNVRRHGIVGRAFALLRKPSVSDQSSTRIAP